MFVRELSAMVWAYYHNIYTKITRGCFATTFHTGQKLPCHLYGSYQLWRAYITMIYIQKLPGYLFNKFSPKNNCNGVWCTSYQDCDAYIITSFTQELPSIYFKQLFFSYLLQKLGRSPIKFSNNNYSRYDSPIPSFYSIDKTHALAGTCFA